MPMPPPISSQSALCFAVAPRSRGNQASGTETVRPSARTTFNSSVVHETATAVTSLLSTKVVMPPLQKEHSIPHDNASNLRKLVPAKAAIVRQIHRAKPELRVSPRMSNMYMWWLATLHAEEEEPVTT